MFSIVGQDPDPTPTNRQNEIRDNLNKITEVDRFKKLEIKLHKNPNTKIQLRRLIIKNPQTKTP